MKLLCLVHFFTACVFALTLNIYTGPPDRGGFGDIAANVRMAGYLKEVWPKAQVNLILGSDEVAEMVRILIPGSPLYDESPKEMNGIHIYPAKTPLPKADYVFSFSIDTIPVPHILDTAPRIYLFNEYGNYGKKPRQDLMENGQPLPERYAKHEIEFFATGVGKKEGGLYLPPKPASPPLNRAELIDRLQDIPVRVSGNIDNDPQLLLAFGYSSELASTNNYVKAVCHLATQPTYKNQKILIVVQKPIPHVIPPPNVEIRSYSKLPFEVSQSLVAHSHFPILATGDVSATFALEYAVPFIYEMHPWKYHFIGNTLKQLIQQNPNLIPYRSQLSQMMMLPYFKRDTWKTFADIMQNKKMLSELRVAIKRLTAEHSLTHNIKQLIEVRENVGSKESIHGILWRTTCQARLHQLGKNPNR